MAMRIDEAASSGLGHAAFDAVPRTTGRSPSQGDPQCMKLLMFIDGSSSLRDLAEVLSIEPADMVRIVTVLFADAVIAFDAEFERTWLREPGEPAPGEAPPSPEPAGEGRVRVIIGAPAAPPPREPAGEEASVEEADVPGTIVEEGRLDDTPAWQVLTRIARTKFGGRIRFSDAAGRRDVLMWDGQPTFCESDVPEHDIGSLLRTRDRVGEDEYRLYVEAMGAEPGDGARKLVRLGILPEYNRLRALRWQAQTILFGTLELESGTFLVEQLERYPARTPRFDLSFSRILTKFLDEKLPVDDEIKKLDEKLDFYLVPTPGASELSFQEKEQRLWDVVKEKPRRLKELFSVSTMFRKDTYKFILLLLVNGLAELTRSVTFDEGPIDLRLLDDIAEDLEAQNHFDVLGVHAVGDLQDLEAGHKRILKKFDAAAFTHLDERQAAVLGRCRARIDRAFEVLRDDSRRDEYRREVYSAYQLAQFAQLQYQKGEIYLWWRQNPRDSFPFFRSALELDPAQPIYWAAYAISALMGGSQDARVRSQASKLADRVAGLPTADPVALVMAGGALMKIGQAARGEECIQKARRLSPGNAAISKMINTIVSGRDG